MPAFRRDTLSPSHTADAIPSAHEPIAAWTTRPWGVLGERGHGTPWCVHSPPALGAARRTRPGPPPSSAVSLPASPRSVAAARRFSRGLLAEWGLDELADDAVLLLSELVTNAIVHVPGGAGEVRLALSRTPAQLVVQVTDGGGRLPLCAEAGPDSENGRGMWLVEQLAAEWGHHTSGGGKTIWFTLPLPGAAPLR
ncbi:ATP-binding protein [Streptomyces abikoensis]|uniref:ATP-binding protein n=1 Tax=Streptomyces abikoensis TaxID=97398 RepID=UPI001674B7E1|nr:ATP-binding protein [Streptomyces abikoensis]GGP36297.1 hypothetical protein GCM10010214_06450 [Streptomyces abikoensis]